MESALAKKIQRPVHSIEQPLTKQDFWEEVSCNLCGEKEVHIKYEGTSDPDTEKLLSSYSASGNFISEERLVKCKNCGLVFTSPRLSPKLILKGYEETADPNYVSQGRGRILSFAQCLRAVSKYVKGGNVLDVGAAAGFFLKVAKDKGWKTYGIEPSRYLSDYGNKNFDANIYQGTIETAPSWGPIMDLVTLWDVLEHTVDPQDVLRRCNRYLKRGGVLVVNYPNIGNWMARLAGRKWWFILSVHLYYYTPNTIEKALKRAGFEVVKQGPHFQWLEFGYLIYRLEAYLPSFAKMLSSAAKFFRLDRVLIPYYAAQTRVVARKVRAS